MSTSGLVIILFTDLVGSTDLGMDGAFGAVGIARQLLGDLDD